MGEYVQVNDVGPRDGLQNQPRTLTVAERLQLIQSLVQAGLRAIEIGSFVSAKAVPQMAGTAELAADLPECEGCVYSALAPNMRGYTAAREAGIDSISVPVSATDTMNEKNLRMSTAQIMDVTAEIIRTAQKDGARTLIYISVAFECPFEGRVPAATVLDMAERLFRDGADELIIADTIGAAAPDAAGALMKSLCAEHGSERLACHFHDTRALAVANVCAALDAGIRKFDSAVGGLGGCPFAPGAAGNLATEDLTLLLHQMGFETGIDLAALLDTVQLLEGLLGAAGGRSFAWLHGQMQKNAALPEELRGHLVS